MNEEQRKSKEKNTVTDKKLEALRKKIRAMAENRMDSKMSVMNGSGNTRKRKSRKVIALESEDEEWGLLK